MLEYNESDCRAYGSIFEKAMMKTDPAYDMQTRKGQACLLVVEQVLEQLLDSIKEDSDGSES